MMPENRESIRAYLYDSSDIPIAELSVCTSMVLIKERYTPFHSLKVSFLSGVMINAESCARIRLSIGGEYVFDGRTSGVSCKESAEGFVLSGRAYSYTRSLIVGEAVPGMFYQAGINSIKNANTPLPKVNYQQNGDTANYIYIKETDTIWDAYTALAVKLYQSYPYIHGENTVYIKKADMAEFDLSGEVITGLIRGENYKNSISKISMQNTEGQYEYTREDSAVKARGIVSERFIPLDRQWLSSVQAGLEAKLKYAKRGCEYRGLTYIGYSGEQICDVITFTRGSESFTGEADRIEIRADSKGIRTTVICYNDGYCSVSDE